LALLLAAPAGPTAGRAGSAAASPELPVGAAGSLLYLALGDSVAAGIGASHPEREGYAALLGHRLGELFGVRVLSVNLAVPGETTGSFLAGGQLEAAEAVLAAAARTGVTAGPITLTLGANDLLRAEPTADGREAALDRIAGNLRTALERLRAAAAPAAGETGPTLIVTGYYDPTGTAADEPGSDGWWLAQLDATLEAEARRSGAEWVDVAAAFRGRERETTHFPFDIHPTDSGHRLIATAVWRALVVAASKD